jgi:hypothetical protein
MKRNKELEDLYDDGEGWPEGDDEEIDDESISEGDIQPILQSQATKLSEEIKTEKVKEEPKDESKESNNETSQKSSEDVLKIDQISPSKPQYEEPVPEDEQDQEEGAFYLIYLYYIDLDPEAKHMNIEFELPESFRDKESITVKILGN